MTIEERIELNQQRLQDELYNQFIQRYPRFDGQCESVRVNELNQLIIHTFAGEILIFSGEEFVDLPIPTLQRVYYTDSDDLDDQAYLEEFGKRLELFLLLNCRMRMDVICHRIGISERTMYYWRSGRSWPSFQNIRALAKLAGCTVDDLTHWGY